jgi:hypothetical protein
MWACTELSEKTVQDYVVVTASLGTLKRKLIKFVLGEPFCRVQYTLLRHDVLGKPLYGTTLLHHDVCGTPTP